MSIERRLYVGSISGTSVDGLDLALLTVGSDARPAAADTHTEEVRIRFGPAATVPFPAPLRAALLALGQPGADDLDRIGQADAELGRFIGEAINAFLAQHAVAAADVSAIGSHGQTIRHRPDLPAPFTWQIGDPNQIAEQTGITTVADFRRRDMAAGGQGAPLVPAFHEALFRRQDESRVIANIGGIANITHLCADPMRPVTGFDTGPGNALLDAWCAAHTGRPMDVDGTWARSGTLVNPLLEALLGEPYLAEPPPKSTGRESFNLAWLERYEPAAHAPEDVQRTLLEYTAISLIEAIARWAMPAERLVVCGGGRRNGFLMERLAELTSMPVEVSELLGYDGDAMEAAAFAWLASRRLAALPGNAPDVTGADGLRVLGAIYPGRPTPDG